MPIKYLGYDYGTKPRFMLVPSSEMFAAMQAEILALGYSQIAEFGLLVNPPVLAILFENEQRGRAFFKAFTTGDGESWLGISFIEFNDGEYGLCIYMEPKAMLRRELPPALSGEIDELATAFGRLKLFGRKSEHYLWFKSMAINSPVVVTAADADGRMIMDVAFRKLSIAFYSEDEVPPNSMEAVLVSSRRDSENDTASYSVPEMQPDSGKLWKRRHEALSRFFPVTIERLEFNKEFQEIRRRLEGRDYRRWQITQASCNLILRERVPELLQPPDSNLTQQTKFEQKIDILYYLLSNFEPATSALPNIKVLNPTYIVKQIQADSNDLLDYVLGIGRPELTFQAVQRKLDELSLLDSP